MIKGGIFVNSIYIQRPRSQLRLGMLGVPESLPGKAPCNGATIRHPVFVLSLSSPVGGFHCNQSTTMKLKLLPTIIAVAACLCCPLANAKPTLTPYQIVHKDSGMCIDMLARLENCDHDSPMQKFYFLNVGSLEDVIPQTATNPAGTSSRIVIIPIRRLRPTDRADRSASH